MRIAFMGTPDFAATILDSLVEHHEVTCVYTRPDAVRGRGKKLEPSPVKIIAQKHGIPVYEPSTLRNEEVQQELASYAPDMICVAAYGAILPQEVLGIPRFGCLNIHASLLPRWRGAAPIERAILAGDELAGVCIMNMEIGLDTGSYCAVRHMPILDMPSEELTQALACLGVDALLGAIRDIEQKTALWTVQDELQVTYAEKIQKGELDLHEQDSVSALCRKVQASSAAHPSRVIVAERSLTAIELREVNDEKTLTIVHGILPLQVRFASKRLFMGAVDGVVELILLKPDGKQTMDARAFAAGVQGIKSGSFTWGSMNG